MELRPSAHVGPDRLVSARDICSERNGSVILDDILVDVPADGSFPSRARAALVGATGNSPGIDEQVILYRIRRGFPGRRVQIGFDTIGFWRHLTACERLQLVLATTDNGYVPSRMSACLLVHRDEPGILKLNVPAVATDDAEFVGATPTG